MVPNLISGGKYHSSLTKATKKIEIITSFEESSDLMHEGRSACWVVQFLPLPDELGSSKILLSENRVPNTL